MVWYDMYLVMVVGSVRVIEAIDGDGLETRHARWPGCRGTRRDRWAVSRLDQAGGDPGSLGRSGWVMATYPLGEIDALAW